MPSRDDKAAPLSDASESDINRLVDDVLRSGKHLTLPADGDAPETERYHARAIATQMHRLAQQLSHDGAPAEGHDNLDEWWFEVGGKRIGPISLKKIRFLWEDGELTPDSLCWHDGFPRWVSLFKVSELAEALTPRLHVNVDDAARAFAKAQSGEWASPAGTAMEAANRKRLESSQKLSDPLPLSTTLNLADERAGTYTALRAMPASADDEPTPPARPSFAHAVVSGLVAGAIAAGAIVATRLLWPMPELPAPIVINMVPGAAGAPPAPAAAPVVAPHPKAVEPVAAAFAPVAAAAGPVAPAPAAAKPAAVAAAPAAAPAPEPQKPATVEAAFAKAFAEAPPDELTLPEVFEVVRSHKAQTEACVDAQHAATPDATGKLVMHWSVEPDGHVTDVTAPPGEMSKSALADCLAREISGWTFPKHAMAHPPVEFPFKY